MKVKNLNYSERIVQKLPEENHIRFGRVLLSDNSIKEIPFFIYLELSVGDSIVKLKNSDSIVYIKKSGEKIYDDINEFDRKKYLEKINRK